MKLNLGCGQNKLAGYRNVDKYDACDPDQVVDLELFPWPFADDSADEIVMNHVLEHLGAATDTFLQIIKELYRVLKPGAQLQIRVPHPRSEGFLGDPTHVRPINQAIMSLFSKRNNREWKEKGWPNTPLGLYLDVDLELRSATLTPTPLWSQRHRSGEITREQLNEAMESYNNVIDEIHMVVEKIGPSRKVA